MSDIYNNSKIKTGYLDIKVICINYCTDEAKYLDHNSHFIHIPRKIYYRFLDIKKLQGKEEKPLYVGVRNPLNKTKRLCFGRVEPSVVTPNSTHDMILLPEWAIENLELNGISDVVDLVYINQPQPIVYLKIRGNNSSYVKHPNIKLALEDKLSNCNCLNVGEIFTIEDVKFTITEIKNANGTILEYGAVFDSEVNLDFEVPDDLAEEERKRLANPPMERILQKASDSTNEIKSKTKVINPNTKLHKYGSRIHTFNGDTEKEEQIKSFDGPGMKLQNDQCKKLSKSEIMEMRLKKLSG